MTDLGGKVLIVTGASRGIGAAAAKLFAARGALVALAARDERALGEVAAAIAREGGEAHVPTDVTDGPAVENLVTTTVRRCGRLDGAFNNAGHGHRRAPLAELDPADFDRALAVTLRGVFLGLRAELAELADGGAIVNTSSCAGLSGAPRMGAYSAAKHGVIVLTKTAALDYGPKGIRVNAVAPGPIVTPGASARHPRTCRRRSRNWCHSSASAPRGRSHRSQPGCSPTRPRSSTGSRSRSTAASSPGWD